MDSICGVSCGSGTPLAANEWKGTKLVDLGSVRFKAKVLPFKFRFGASRQNLVQRAFFRPQFTGDYDRCSRNQAGVPHRGSRCRAGVDRSNGHRNPAGVLRVSFQSTVEMSDRETGIGNQDGGAHKRVMLIACQCVEQAAFMSHPVSRSMKAILTNFLQGLLVSISPSEPSELSSISV